MERWGSTFTAEQINAPDFGVVANRVAERSNELARRRDAYARRLLEERLPRPLRWIIDRPKALKALLRVVPRWRPTMNFVDLRPWGWPGMTADAARAVGQGWIDKQIADGKQIPNGILIFTYTDPSGLPAEVCGVE